jgi:apolipoprotein N-acyltransferase
MTYTSLRRRFWVESTLAALFAFAAGLTLWQHSWMEVLFGVDPDRGSGSLELTITLALGAATLLLTTLARREWIRPRDVSSSPPRRAA